MSRRKHYKSLGYLLAAAAGAATVWLSLNRDRLPEITSAQLSAPPARPAPETGYKARDRQKLEQLIHEGTKND